MSCPCDKERLSGYFDGELAAADKAEVEQHISACSECLRDLGELKSSALLVTELPRLRAPASIAQAVARETRQAGRLRSLDQWRKGMLWTVSAAAALLVVVNVFYFSGASPEAGRPADPGIAWTASPKPPVDEMGTRADPAKKNKNSAFGDARNRPSDETADADLKMKKLELEKQAGASAPKKAAEDGKPLEEAAKAPLPAAAPAPKEERAREADKYKREPAPGAAKPAAPAAAPAPAPDLRRDALDRALPEAEERKSALRQSEADPANLAKGKDAGPGGPAPTCLLVTASDTAAARRKAQEFGKSKAPTGGLSYSLPEGRRGIAGAPEPVELFLTDRQIDELKKDLIAQHASVMAVGTPEEAGALCAAPVRQQAGDKAGAAGGRASPDPDAAPHAAEPEKPAPRSAQKEAAAPQPGKAEPRRRVLLYFRAAQPGEAAPPAAEKK